MKLQLCGALTRPKDPLVGMGDWKWTREHPIHKCGLPHQATSAIESRVADGSGITTLEDLQFCSRDEIAAIKKVGPKAMAALDAAMAKHGLRFGRGV